METKHNKTNNQTKKKKQTKKNRQQLKNPPKIPHKPLLWWFGKTFPKNTIIPFQIED